MLAVPLAVQAGHRPRLHRENAGFVDQYFAMMLVIVALLAAGSAGRYYFVTWLGERVVADLRRKVFRHLLSLSPGFYDAQSTGEMMSRLTADTTQLKSLFGSSISVALRNLGHARRLGGDDGGDERQAVRPRSSAIPLIVLPLVLTGRRVRGLSRDAQDTLARSAGLAQESLGAVPTIQAYGQTARIRDAFARATEEAFAAAGWRTAVRGWLTAAIIFIAFGSVVAVLWYGAQEVLAGELSGGALGQFVLYAAFAALATGALSEIWGEVQLAAGAAERLTEILAMKPEIEAPANPRPLPVLAAAAPWLRRRPLCLSDAARPEGAARGKLQGRPGRAGGHRRPIRRRQEHDLQPDPEILRSPGRPRADRRRRCRRSRPRRGARPHRLGAAGDR
jgi:ATP-binding cassette, subfamily B, bacterial